MRTSYCFFLSLFLPSLIHAMEVPVKKKEELITIKFMDETANPGINLELDIERDRFRYFRDQANDLNSTVLEFYSPDYPKITSESVIFLDELYKTISVTDLKKFEESCKQGTFFIPQSSRIFFDRYKLSLEKIYEKIAPASYLEAGPILDLLLCEYAEQILINPLSIDDAKNVQFPKDLDSVLAKILIHKALMEKFVVDTKKNEVPVGLNSTLNYLLYTTITQNVVTLCPTAEINACVVMLQDPISGNTKNIRWAKQNQPVAIGLNVSPPAWVHVDQQKGSSSSLLFWVREGADEQRNAMINSYRFIFMDATKPYPKRLYTLEPRTSWKDELDLIPHEDLRNAKIIFMPDSERSFYLKIQNTIWLCTASAIVNNQGVVLKKLVQPDTIQDPWVKKYLTSTPEELGTCWGIMPCSSNDFFNTCCLDPFRGSDEYRVVLQNNVGKQLGKSDWRVEQQTCSSNGPESIHYALFRRKKDTKNHYYLTESTFKLDSYTQSLLKCMNDMYEADYNPEKPLYASAAYINRACAKNYTLSASELQKEMGALDGLVSQQVKDILFPSSKKEHMYRLIRRYIEPYKQQIKYGLGALTLGALSYAAYKTVPKIYNYLPTMRIGYGIKGDGSGPGHRSGHNSGHHLGRSGSRPLGTK